jgi:hypothetical protein
VNSAGRVILIYWMMLKCIIGGGGGGKGWHLKKRVKLEKFKLTGVRERHEMVTNFSVCLKREERKEACVETAGRKNFQMRSKNYQVALQKERMGIS